MIRVIVTGAGAVGFKVADGLGKIFTGVDVVIDFTAPEASIDHLREASKAGVAIVVGTTGLTKEHLAEARRLTLDDACEIVKYSEIYDPAYHYDIVFCARTLGDD